MKYKRFLILLYYMLFWIIYFEISRIIFLLFNINEFNGASFVQILGTFFHGFRLDMSAVSYIIIPAIPIFIISAFFKSHKVLKISLNIYTGILLAIISILVLGDAETYKSWGFRVDNTPLQYFNTPELISASLTTGKIILLVCIYIIFISGMFSLYYFWIARQIKDTKNEKLFSLLYLIIAAVLIIPLRGGLGIVPINVSSGYHSDNMFLNHASINIAWNFGQSVITKGINYEQLEFYDEDTKNRYLSEATYSKDTFITALNNEKPKHIIFIVLESFTANAIGILGGEQELTPKIDKWSSEGILFNNFYANSDRSDKGLVSIFSSTPPLLNYSLMKHPSMSRHLPSLISELADNGYGKSSFYYGGDVNFSNMQSYLKQAKFQDIIVENNLNLDCPKSSKWGYHDECMFDLLYDDIINETDSSVHTLFTLSSHEPYDIPGKKLLTDNNETDKARNSYFYTDSCLNVFLEKLYNSPKWENSLVIIVSDHGTRFPGNVYSWDLKKYHILMLWLGGALKTEPFVYSKPADQLDISATLLSELNIPYDKFIFSENIFRKETPSVFYSFTNGFAFMKDSDYYIFDINTKEALGTSENYEVFEKYAKSYMQQVAEYYKELEK